MVQKSCTNMEKLPLFTKILPSWDPWFTESFAQKTFLQTIQPIRSYQSPPPHGPPQSDDSAADRHRGASCDLGSKCAWVAVRQFENPETPVDWHDVHQFSHLDVLRLLKNPYMVGYYNHLYTVNIQNFGHCSLLGRMHLFWWVFLLEQDIPCHKCVLPDSLFEGRLSPWAGGMSILLFVCLWYFYKFVNTYTPEN